MKGTGTMPERTEYPAGTFCWVNLATTDQEAVKSFYGALLGWSYEGVPTDVGNTYNGNDRDEAGRRHLSAARRLPGDATTLGQLRLRS